mmetsp:Transcript_28260/g.81074  ORF Transcript_28260/g.81074 Transcript_28260/m.81074 type:complete len:87 (-) Transcript_28260:501-761(-)
MTEKPNSDGDSIFTFGLHGFVVDPGVVVALAGCRWPRRPSGEALDVVLVAVVLALVLLLLVVMVMEAEVLLEVMGASVSFPVQSLT